MSGYALMANPTYVDCGAQAGEFPQMELEGDFAAQPAPGYEVDQRDNWRGIEAVILQELRAGAAATAQTAPLKGARSPNTRAMLGHMWLNFYLCRSCIRNRLCPPTIKVTKPQLVKKTRKTCKLTLKLGDKSCNP